MERLGYLDFKDSNQIKKDLDRIKRMGSTVELTKVEKDSSGRIYHKVYEVTQK